MIFKVDSLVILLSIIFESESDISYSKVSLESGWVLDTPSELEDICPLSFKTVESIAISVFSFIFELFSKLVSDFPSKLVFNSVVSLYELVVVGSNLFSVEISFESNKLSEWFTIVDFSFLYELDSVTVSEE